MSDFVGPINHLCTQGLTGAPVAQRSLMVAIALSDEGPRGGCMPFWRSARPRRTIVPRQGREEHGPFAPQTSLQIL